MRQQLPMTFWQRSQTIVGAARADEFHKIGQQDTRQALERFIIEHSTPETALLDAGCNTGVEGYRLMAAGFPGRYQGVDSNPRALAFALENLVGTPSSFTLADLQQIPFADGAFDIVLNKDVIEHAQSYEGIVRELARLTRRYLVLSMFIKLNPVQDAISLHPDGYYLNSYERGKFLNFMSALGLSAPQIIFENSTDEVLVFEKLG